MTICCVVVKSLRIEPEVVDSIFENDIMEYVSAEVVELADTHG